MLSTCWHPPFIHGEAPTTTGGSAVERQHRQRPCVPFHENMDDSSVSNEKTLEVNADLKSGLHPEAFGAGGPAAAAAAAAKSCSIREKWQQHPGRALVSRRRSKAAKLLSPTVPILIPKGGFRVWVRIKIPRARDAPRDPPRTPLPQNGRTQYSP